MCKECGCGEVGAAVHLHAGHFERPEHEPTDHRHGHGLSSEHEELEDRTHSAEGIRRVQIERSLLEKNDRLAERNRGFFLAKHLCVINMLSAPGAGKTTLLTQTHPLLLERGLRMGVIVGDLATTNDATRLREAGIPSVQVTTGTVCHLDAQMVFEALKQLPLNQLDLIVIENVGNLVCPADFDLGEFARVVLFSVPEGEDKPAKYPVIFHRAQLVILSKIDLAEAVGFQEKAALDHLHRIAHHAELLRLSAKTGEGLDRWADWLANVHERFLQQCPV